MKVCENKSRALFRHGICNISGFLLLLKLQYCVTQADVTFISIFLMVLFRHTYNSDGDSHDVHFIFTTHTQFINRAAENIAVLPIEVC